VRTLVWLASMASMVGILMLLAALVV